MSTQPTHVESFAITTSGKDYKFNFDPSDDTYKWGESNNGIGIYFEDGKLAGNIVVSGNIEFVESKPEHDLYKFAEICVMCRNLYEKTYFGNKS